MKKILIISAFALTLFLTSCSDPMVGTWVMPATNWSPEQGFELKKDGTAEAINMDFIQFTSWKKEDGKLFINGKNTGSAHYGEFTDEMNIVKVTKEDMKLSIGTDTLTYFKKEIK